MTEEKLGVALKQQAELDLLKILERGQCPPWWPDGPDLAKDVSQVLKLIADDGGFYWLDNNSAIKRETTTSFNLEQPANALALVRHLQNDLKYVTAIEYDNEIHAYRFGFTRLGQLVFELWEANQEW